MSQHAELLTMIHRQRNSHRDLVAHCLLADCATMADELTLTNMKPFTRLTVDPRVCGGQPCVRGLRIPVSVVLKHLAVGKTVDQILDELPELEAGDIPECLRYAAWLASGRSIELPAA